MSGRRPGPEPILDDDVAGRILDMVRRGATYHAAARAAGISRRTLTNWIAKAKAGDERYAAFGAQVDEATAASEAALINVIHDCGIGGDWRAAIALLEKRFPKRYGRRAPIIVHNHSAQGDAEKLSNAELVKSLLEDPELRKAAMEALAS